MLPTRELFSARSKVDKRAGSRSLLYSRVQYIKVFNITIVNSYTFFAEEGKKAAHLDVDEC